MPISLIPDNLYLISSRTFRMAGFQIFKFIAILSTLPVISVTGQISTPCTSSMITSFTPCINYLTGSTNNGSLSPTASCCNSLKSLMRTSMDCACLVITANVPIPLPISWALAVFLPQACNMGGVPVQCKASGTPLPAPGPVLLGPTLPPTVAASSLRLQASKAAAAAAPPPPAPAPAPDSDQVTLPLAPASPPLQVEVPPTTAAIRPLLSPSACVRSYMSPPFSLLVFIAFFIFRCY